MSVSRLGLFFGFAVAAAALFLTAEIRAQAVGPLVQVSGASPFGALETCGNFPGSVAGVGTNFLDSEIEPWVDVNPVDPDNVVALWQQDRWSNGGSIASMPGWV